MVSEIVMALVGVVCSAISSVITFLLTRRKYNTEVDSQQIENMEKSFDIYKKMMEETLEAQKKAMESTTNAQNEKIASLQKENDLLRNQVNQLQGAILNFITGSNLSEVKNKLMPLTDLLNPELK